MGLVPEWLSEIEPNFPEFFISKHKYLYGVRELPGSILNFLAPFPADVWVAILFSLVSVMATFLILRVVYRCCRNF